MKVPMRKIETGPGGPNLYELTERWAGLARGTVVTPLSAGWKDDADAYCACVTVAEGPRAGEKVEAPVPPQR